MEVSEKLIVSLAGAGIVGLIAGRVADDNPQLMALTTGLLSGGLVGYKTDSAILFLVSGGAVGYVTYNTSKNDPGLVGLTSGMITFGTIWTRAWKLFAEEKPEEEKVPREARFME